MTRPARLARLRLIGMALCLLILTALALAPPTGKPPQLADVMAVLSDAAELHSPPADRDGREGDVAPVLRDLAALPPAAAGPALVDRRADPAYRALPQNRAADLPHLRPPPRGPPVMHPV